MIAEGATVSGLNRAQWRRAGVVQWVFAGLCRAVTVVQMKCG